MSAAQEDAQASGQRAEVLREVSELPKLDQAAVHAVAHKVRLAIAEGNAYGEGLGLLGLALVGTELQEQAISDDLFRHDNALLLNESDAKAMRGAS